MRALYTRGRNFLQLASISAALLGSGAMALAESCPTATLAPSGIAPPDGGHCNSNGCLVSFKNYKWWTAFTFNKSEGYYNGGLGTIFAPEHVRINGDGHMMLKMAKDWNNGAEWAGAEAVLMFNADGSPASLGYGDYLVDASFSAPPQSEWSELDPNVAFGVFTFERPATGSADNPSREIDLAEISRWGWNHVSPKKCPFTGKQNQFDRATLCDGNAQFALQDFTKKAGMVNRYTIVSNRKEITLVMRWRNKQVSFEQYDKGGLTLSTLPKTPDSEWITPDSGAANLSPFVPNKQGCTRFHINLWLGNYEGKQPYAPHDGPTNNQDVSIVIKDFEFKAAQ